MGALPVATIAARYTNIVNADWLRLGIGVVILATLIVQYTFQITLQVGGRGLLAWCIPIGGLIGTAGPFMALAFRGYGLERQRFVATVAVVQPGIQVVRLPTYLSTKANPEK